MASLAFFFTFLGAVRAQESPLDPVTVTASLSPSRVSQTGRNLIVIRGEQFSNLPVYSLDELLRYLPGIELQARGPFGAQSDLTLRGGTFQQVLVIVDGLRVNDPNTGHFSTYIPIAPAEIERIEILKGASSALFGSDAVGGVVHIITKSFAAKTATKNLQSTAQVAGGEYGFFSVNAGVFASTASTSFGAGILSNNTSGQLQRGNRGFVHATTGSVSVSHRFNSEWSLALRTAYDRRRFAAQNFYTSAVSDTAEETVGTFWNQLQLLREHANNVFRVQVGYKHVQDSFSFNRLTPSNQNATGLWQALLVNERRLGAKTVLTPGLQFINKRIASNDRGDHNLSQAAAFAVLNQQIGEAFFAAPAVRLEWAERVGWQAVPQLNLSFRKNIFQLRGSIGKTFRDADFTERFNNWGKTIVSAGQRLGNPELTPENSVSYEAGLDLFLQRDLKLSGSWFRRHHNNLIDYVLTPAAQIPRNVNLIAGANYSFARNLATVNTVGYEADVQYQKTSGQNLWWTTLGLVWLNSQNPGGILSLYLSTHARFQGNFSAGYTGKWGGLSANGVYKKRQQQKVASPFITPVTSDYFLLNLKADVFVLPRRLSAFVQLDNVFDRTYSDLLGALMPGRWFTAGIKVSFAPETAGK